MERLERKGEDQERPGEMQDARVGKRSKALEKSSETWFAGSTGRREEHV